MSHLLQEAFPNLPIKTKPADWRDGSAVESTHCSSKGPGSQPAVTPVLEDPAPSLWAPHVHGTQSSRQTKRPYT